MVGYPVPRSSVHGGRIAVERADPRYYFHIEENGTTLDDEGTELYDREAARNEAVFTSSGILRDSGGPHFWSGKPWRLWVTDQPGGLGKTLFTIQISATEALPNNS
jgi:hypothetical protein